jgi:hypothetical protein
MFIYDIEVFPNCFTLAAEHCDYPMRWCFEISDYRDDSVALIEWLHWLRDTDQVMVGFNNVGFDYPIVHMLLKMGKVTPKVLYEKAQAIIGSQDLDRWQHQVYPSDRVIPQIDLYMIHHFDNKARTTSLKALEFNMRLDNVSDLPFPVGTVLNPEQIVVLRRYNMHDVAATKRFYHESLDRIRFRQELTARHNRDFTNHNDTKIGAEIFQMSLEGAGVQCYDYGRTGRQPRQTHRPSIRLKDCVPQWIQFEHPEFKRIKEWFEAQVITETKGVFTDVVAHVGGLEFIYGTGGLHASVEKSQFISDDEWMIYDMDVTSLYPSIAIEHGHYPQHLGPRFVDVYRDLRSQRASYAKGTAENAMLKLALNGTYGKSNDKFSIFYDPQFTMSITIGGQLMMSLLAERILSVGVQIIQVNTDGITMMMRRDQKFMVDMVCRQWEQETRLSLEYAEYSKMVIRDVNNYIAVGVDGKVKRKGAYEWKCEWHQDASALVVPKVAEQVLLHDAPIRKTVEEWADRMDFMLRIKVPRSSKLLYIDGHDESEIQNTTRYYISTEGGRLVKVMPPLKGKTEWRRFEVEKGVTCCVCNDIKDAVMPINYDYYVTEVEKLVLGVM